MAASLKLGNLRTQRSFETIYQAHVRDVYRYAFALTGNAADAEDVTQTTFMNAFRAFRDGERPLKPQNWLLKIAHNVCRQRMRTASRRPLEVAYDEDVAAALVPDAETPSATDIRRALAHLPVSQRATLVMRELEGRTHAEIADVLGISVTAAEMLAFRARRALREHLAGSLTCTEAEATLDRQADGSLDHEQAGLLRAHLRECEECRRTARRIRAQRSAWRALGTVPLPASLGSFAGTGGAVATGVGVALVTKAAAVTAAAATAVGGVYAVKHELAGRHAPVAPPHAVTTSRSRATAHPVVTNPSTRRPPTAHTTPAASPMTVPATPAATTIEPSPPPAAVEAAPTAAATTEERVQHVPARSERKARVKPLSPPRKDSGRHASSCATTPRQGASPCSRAHSQSPRH